ncbi:MAG TPA: serine/threonine-protein phosphatase [Caldithrix abyssi]|uniref:Serine/threonine-protein phosphatase n=1 Tax=Caldithrix abyssi TaxID=187145 RepID=A0A7V1PT88_CALAY|nr:serine/threonine-protein phosphatase [Caldithrix abyssi]
MNPEEYRLAQDMLISDYEHTLLQKYGLEHLIEKIILKQSQLIEKNNHLEKRLSNVNEDLNNAREAQMNLLPRDIPEIDALEFRARFFPSQYVSGDTYNIMRLDEIHVGLYQIDISGHGVSSALFSVSLSQMLNTTGANTLLKSHLDKPPYYRIHEPDEVMSRLNDENFFDRYGFYLTMVYMLINVQTGEVRYARAGHNAPIIQRRDGSVESDPRGGLPIGWDFSRDDPVIKTKLCPGDRLFIYSDGVCEAAGAVNNEWFGQERLIDVIKKEARKPVDDVLDSTIRAIADHTKRTTFDDDVSILAVTYKGPGRKN